MSDWLTLLMRCTRAAEALDPLDGLQEFGVSVLKRFRRPTATRCIGQLGADLAAPFGGSRANRAYSSFFETQAGLNRIRPYSESLDRRFILMSPRVPRTPQLAVFT